MYNHKLNFHINGGRSDAFEAAFRLKPKIVKTLDFSVEPMRQLREQILDLFLIGRLFVHPQDFGQLGGGYDPGRARRRGMAMAEKILRLEVNQSQHHFNGQPLFQAWESLNEVLPESATDDYHKLYDEYQVAFLETMRANGFEAIGQNFGTGNGTAEQWLTLYPGTLESYKYLGFHEYDWPTMSRLHEQGLREGNGGRWLCLRYRRIMEGGIRQQYGDQHICIITECGMTQGVWGGSAQDIGPWASQNTVAGNNTATPIPVDDYWNSLLWYNNQLMQDDYVLGACLFVTGASGGWDTFEHLGPIMERLAAFQQVISGPDPKPPPQMENQMIGLNIDIGNLRGNPTISELHETLKTQTVRYTYRDGSSGNTPDGNQLNLYRQKISALAEVGVSSLLILTNESLPGNPASSASDGEWDSYIARLAGRAKQLAEAFKQWKPAFQIWNEPDYLEPHPGYDPTLRPTVFAKMLRACYQAIKAADVNLVVVTGGLNSGQPSWLQQVITTVGNLYADAVAIHPYGQRPEPNWPDSSWGFGYIGDLIGAYQQVTSTPLWITEIGVNTGGAVTSLTGNQRRHLLLPPPSSASQEEADSEGSLAEDSLVETASNQLQGDYLSRFYTIMIQRYANVVQRVYWFCYADGMVPPFGLLDINGTPKPAYTAFRNLARPTEPDRIYAAQFMNATNLESMLFGQLRTISISLKNSGNWSWPISGNNPVKVGYRWLTLDGRDVPTELWSAIRTALPSSVTPGATITINADVVAPRALGPLNLQLDLVEEGVTWFSDKGIAPLNLPIDVRTNSLNPTMTLTASHNNVTSGYDNLINTIDGQVTTRWSTIAVQTPGMWFQVDLGALKTISQITLDNANSPDDYPRGYLVRLSTDGNTWSTVASQPNNSTPVTISFTPTETRYIRIEQTGRSDRYWWSIHELSITSQLTPTARASHNSLSSGRDNLTYLFDNNPYTRWSSRTYQRPGIWLELDLQETKSVSGLTLESAYSPEEYPRGYRIQLSTNGRQWTTVAENNNNTAEVDITFSPQTARYLRIEQTGTSTRWWWAVHGVVVR